MWGSAESMATLVSLALAAAAGAPASPEPGQAESHERVRRALERDERIPDDKRLKLDRWLVGSDAPNATVPPALRFETSVEVRGQTPEQLLQRYFTGFDYREGPTGASAPTHEELRPRPAGQGVPVDFVAPLVWLYNRLRDKTPRYLLYEARQGERTWLALREGAATSVSSDNPSGVTYRLLETFDRRSDAAAAFARLQRSLTAQRPPADAQHELESTVPQAGTPG